MARVVIPGLPHHITQRGVRRMNVFFSDEDRTEYLKHLAEQGERFGVTYLAWCLMTNHAHLIAIPEEEQSLARGIGEAHRKYTRYVNFREGWRGYLFQGRFHSFPLEAAYLLAALRYVLRNPVRAGIARRPWDYPWSSAKWFVGVRLGVRPLFSNRGVGCSAEAVRISGPGDSDTTYRYTVPRDPTGMTWRTSTSSRIDSS